MRCPCLDELPSPPLGKTGWPCTEESPQLPDTMPDGRPWPKVSIVTPSYNQGQFIEETIRSVLLQGYPNLEYIIIDGGSIDNSVKIIKKYDPWLAYWVSEPDRGQSCAINKGWKKATGEILAYLNSDDMYEPGTLFYVGEYFLNNPEVDMIYGECYLIDENGKKLGIFQHKEFNVKKMIYDNTWYIPQQAVFIRKRILDEIGLFNENLHFKIDRDLFIRIGMNGRVEKIPMYMANFRTHPNAKSTFQNTYKAWKEFLAIRKKYGGHFSLRIHLRYYTNTFLTFLRMCVIFFIGKDMTEKIRKLKNSFWTFGSHTIL